MAVAIDYIFQGSRGDTSLPSQGIDVVAIRRAELLNTQWHQLSRIHPNPPSIKSLLQFTHSANDGKILYGLLGEDGL